MNTLLIVGGSKGIGRAILEQQLDLRPCINISRSEPGINHPHLTHISADVLTDELPDLDGISSLVYCPGTINLKPINSLKPEDFTNDFNINVVGAVKVIRQYLRQLKQASNASVTLFSTVAVSQGMPFHASVASAKAAVEGLSRSLAAELAPKIRVNCIAPTMTDTPLAAGILRNDKVRENIAGKNPMKRILDPGDLAHAASFLMSEAASAITGQIFHVDGGMSTLKI